MDLKQVLTDNYAIYNGDCIEKMAIFPDDSMHMTVYSPPFASLYAYSSSNHDLGNCKTYGEFLIHYGYVIKEIERITLPGRFTAVHCMDLPKNGDQGLIDFPGDIIKIHEEAGFKYWDRKNIWKEPLRVAIRTRQRALMHHQLCDDSSKCRGALADYVLIFKKKGENNVPITHPVGLMNFAGDFELMNSEDQKEYQFLKEKYKNYTDDRTNRLSQWIWRRYASSDWKDVNAQRMLNKVGAKDPEDERHVCPLHLDIIERLIVLYSNRGEKVLTPFMGIGSEVYGAVSLGRKGIGIELKESYFNISVKNLNNSTEVTDSGPDLFHEVIDEGLEEFDTIPTEDLREYNMPEM